MNRCLHNPDFIFHPSSFIFREENHLMTDKPTFKYTDLRDWLVQTDKIGELRKVKNATWQEDIGLITEVVGHTRGSPAVLCDEIPGVEPGYRVLVNQFHSYKRIAL